MADPDPHATLLAALASHPVGLDANDCSWAFQQPKTAGPVSAWASRYLTPSTLLTHEELTLLTHLQKTGALKKHIIASATSPPVLPHTESFLASETSALATSTEQLRAQTQQLLTQGRALEDMRARAKAERERRKKMEAQRRRKWTAEAEEAAAAVEELVGILNEEVADLRGTVMGTETDKVEVAREMERDDRVLARLERLAAELVVPDEKGGKEDEGVKRVRELVDKLSSLTQQAVRVRLDRIFLETLHTHAPSSPGLATPPEDLTELQTEIDSLYAEIPAVAQNAADSEFLSPLLRFLAARRAQRGENYVLGGQYIRDVLSHLTSRSAAMASLLQSSQDRDSAVLSLLATIAREAVPAPTPASSANPSRPTTPPNAPRGRLLGSPAKFPPPATPRAISPGKLGRIPFLTPARRRRGASIDHGLDKTTYPELALLSHLGVALPPPSPPAAVPVITDAAVASHVAAQTARVDQLANVAWEDGAQAEAAQVMALLMAALVGGYGVGKSGEGGVGKGEGAMALVDEGVRGKMEEVEGIVESLASATRALRSRVEAVARAGGDGEGEGVKAGFVARWGR
ncbi:hypothetical protein EDC01DRAFT_779071 [Geopyxis carbonaria]|nr:hypothetical protein EDC01DRAFT_779071 [Geopyxis carbonaria]